MIAKRLFDLFFSSLGLLVLSPVFVVVACWIKIDSTGSIFFRQKRMGLHARPFFIYKFRTMVVDAEKTGKQITVGDDCRVTNSGKVLRKYKLDELPQLLNVLKGEMSLVGPRPEVPFYMDMYAHDVKEKILSVRPGITDLASIEFRDENKILGEAKDPQQAYIDKIMPIKQAYYLEYVKNHNIIDDFKIIIKTFKIII